jgi:uncharacterized DUF497 family protein
MKTGYNKDDNMILDKIKELCIARKLKWSSHAASRIQERGISRVDVIHCLNNGEVIEDYPADYPHPSCLVFGYTMQGDIIHVVVGCDQETAYIISAYFPNIEKFERDMKTRKE